MTEATPNAPKPKPRRKASVSAREAEAEDGYAELHLRGVSLRIPVAGRMPYKAIRAFRVGDEDLGIELLLGDEQWNAVLDTDPTFDEMNDLARQVGELLGN